MSFENMDLLEMPFEVPRKAQAQAVKQVKRSESPHLPDEQLRPLAPLNRFGDDHSWADRCLRCSLSKGALEIFEGQRSLAHLDIFWARLFSGPPSSATRQAYHLGENDMVLLLKPSTRTAKLHMHEHWSFTCRRKWLPFLLHRLALEGAVLEKVAVKVAAERDVRHELRMLTAAGRHPSVIQHHGVFKGHSGRHWCLVLEFYPQGDLWHYCSDCLSIPTALSLLHNLLLGLQHIHSKGVFHRDVKPENILVTDERAVLCDFGVAETTEGQRQTARGLTPQYASPEMISGNSMNLTGDVYAAGATFHFMITLQYVNTSIKKVQKSWWRHSAELSFEKSPLRELPVCCQDLLERMICPEWKRLSSREAVRHYAFWSLADPEEEAVASITAPFFQSAPLLSDDLVSTGLGSAPISIFASETSAPLGSGTGSDALPWASIAPGPEAGSARAHHVQVAEEDLSLAECFEELRQKLQMAPEPPNTGWWRDRQKPRPPGVKAPRARRTSVSHWIVQHLEDWSRFWRPRRLSRVEPAKAEFCELF